MRENFKNLDTGSAKVQAKLKELGKSMRVVEVIKRDSKYDNVVLRLQAYSQALEHYEQVQKQENTDGMIRKRVLLSKMDRNFERLWWGS